MQHCTVVLNAPALVIAQLEGEPELPDEILTAPKQDIFTKLVCPRCEKQLLEMDYESHMNSHSTEVLPNLFLGNMQSAHNKKELTVRTGITDILNMAEEVENKFVGCRVGCACEGGGIDCNANAPEAAALPALFNYHTYRVADNATTDLLPLFDATFILIDSVLQRNNTPQAAAVAAAAFEDIAGEEAAAAVQPSAAAHKPPYRMLVHCIQGISRSASVVIAYVMRSQHWSLRKAYEFVHQKRSIVKPIRPFLLQLQRYEQVLGQVMELDGYDGEHPSLDVDQVHDPNVRTIGSTPV